MKIWKARQSFKFGDGKLPNYIKNEDLYRNIQKGDLIYESESTNVITVNGIDFIGVSSGFKRFCFLDYKEDESGTGTPIGFEKVQSRKITSSESTNGYFAVSYDIIDPSKVLVFRNGIMLSNKKNAHSSETIFDFDILNRNEFHINNSGSATNLSGVISKDDIITIVHI